MTNLKFERLSVELIYGGGLFHVLWPSALNLFAALLEDDNLNILDVNPGFNWFSVLYISVHSDLSLWVAIVVLFDFWSSSE